MVAWCHVVEDLSGIEGALQPLPDSLSRRLLDPAEALLVGHADLQIQPPNRVEGHVHDVLLEQRISAQRGIEVMHEPDVGSVVQTLAGAEYSRSKGWTEVLDHVSKSMVRFVAAAQSINNARPATRKEGL